LPLISIFVFLEHLIIHYREEMFSVFFENSEPNKELIKSLLTLNIPTPFCCACQIEITNVVYYSRIDKTTNIYSSAIIYGIRYSERCIKIVFTILIKCKQCGLEEKLGTDMYISVPSSKSWGVIPWVHSVYTRDVFTI